MSRKYFQRALISNIRKLVLVALKPISQQRLIAIAAAVLSLPFHASAQTAQSQGSSQLGTAMPAPSASPGPLPGAAGNPATSDSPSPGELGFLNTLGTRTTFLGNAWGARDWLDSNGISFGLTDTEEVLGNATGGLQRGAVYEGLTQLNLGVDTEKAFGWQGGTLNASALQIHGRGLTQNNLDTLKTVSNIEASRATRLWELWYQQSVLHGQADVKVGQQSLDQEFLVSLYGGVFVNSAFAWPVLTGSDLYSGGPAYPLSSLGARLRVQLSTNITLLGGVFDDNPPGGSFSDDVQTRGAEQSGTRFNLNTGALSIAEIQYALNPASRRGSANPTQSGLPGVYKLGAWYDSGQFAVQPQTMLQGLSRPAGPASSNELLRHNYSIYATIDQAIWKPNREGPQTVGVFLRAMGAPGDRNLVTISLNGGLVLKAPLPHRDLDTLGLGFGYNRIGAAARQLDRAAQATDSATSSIRSSESFIELTYQAQVAPWITLQPDVQYVINPGGGINQPDGTGQRVGDAVIFGARTSVRF